MTTCGVLVTSIDRPAVALQGGNSLAVTLNIGPALMASSNDPSTIPMPPGLAPGLDSLNVQDAIAETYVELSAMTDLQNLTVLFENNLI